MVERAVIIAAGSSIRAADLPERMKTAARPPQAMLQPPKSKIAELDFKQRVAAFEEELLLGALIETGGNQAEAARILRIPQRTMTHKVRSLRLLEKLARS